MRNNRIIKERVKNFVSILITYAKELKELNDENNLS